MFSYNEFITKGLITYLGNKRKLLDFIEYEIKEIINNDKSIDKNNVIIMDGFAGSGVVSRMLKKYAKKLYVNDYEKYSYVVNSCYLKDRTPELQKEIKYYIDLVNSKKLNGNGGFITEKYAPKDDNNIQPGERVFYTNQNAKIIDNIRNLIDDIVPEHLKVYILGELIHKASIHNNTSGVFKGFHKKNGIGHFGGAGENALTRIKGEIILGYPVYYNTGTEVIVMQGDTNEKVKEIGEIVDIVYLDPPYNQHPYGSNYHILNTIIDKKAEIQEEGVSGITKNWYKSEWNKKIEAENILDYLLQNIKAKYILFSYNNEGIIPIKNLKEILEKYGKVKLVEKKYNAYRGSRNLKNRDTHVKELLWILKKSI